MEIVEKQTDMDLTEIESHKAVDIIVFDFDGTITTKDTFALFLRYYAGTARWAFNIIKLLPTFIAYGLKLIDRNAVKDNVIKTFFTNASVKELDTCASEFARAVIPGLIREDAIKALNAHKVAVESLYICSASISPYLDVWAKDNGIRHVLATDLEQSDGRYTGRIKGWNVWGPGKIRRIAAEFTPKPFNIREAYGDSRGDAEMLHAADVSHWKPFRVSEMYD